MAKHILSQQASQQSDLAAWIHWKMSAAAGKPSDNLDVPESRGQRRMIGGDTATSFVFLYAKHQGLFTAAEWQQVEVWHTLTVQRRRKVMATIFERVFPISFSELLHQCDFIRDAKAQHALADWMRDITTYLIRGMRSIPASREPHSCPLKGFELPERLLLPSQRKPQKQADASEGAKAAGELPLSLLALLARVIAGDHDAQTPKHQSTPIEAPPLPEAGALADLVEFALNHDLGLLE